MPLALIYWPGLGKSRCVFAASLLVVLGAFALLYVFIIGGQAYPLNIFPGYEATSSFGDGQIASYSPSIYEFMLGFGGLAIAFIITTDQRAGTELHAAGQAVHHRLIELNRLP